MKALSEIDLNNKKVGIRLDLNVPISAGKILDHEKLKAALPSKLIFSKKLVIYVLSVILEGQQKEVSIKNCHFYQ